MSHENSCHSSGFWLLNTRLTIAVGTGTVMMVFLTSGDVSSATPNSRTTAVPSAASSTSGGITLQPRMGEPLAELTVDEWDRWAIGRIEYQRNFTVEEGLGPIFNQTSCASCHNNPVGGTGSQKVTRFGAIGGKGEFDPLTHLGGSLQQKQAISAGCEEVIPPEATITANRVTNSSLAFGLIESITDADLLANESITPPITGRAHMVSALEDPGGPLRVGRFGWKAQVPTVLTFSADAAKNEMGITNRLDGVENAPNGDAATLAACDTVADPEDAPDGQGYDFIDRVTDFQRFLAPPPQTPRSGMAGEALFNAVGCNACHVPAFTTSNDVGLEDALRNRVIRPYSDFLLHNMGTLADGIEQGDALGQEIRTPPLWGLRVRNPLIHDGRVAGGTFESRIEDAIAEHDATGSEAQASAQNFAALTPAEKASVYAFLDSLGRAEFDADGNNEIDEADFVDFGDCYGMVGITPDDPCAVHDIDQDGDVDSTDSAWFITAWDGLRRDCNGNSITDLQDILDGVLVDADDNAVPDSCEPTCDADSDGSGSVNVTDLLTLLSGWGPCDVAPAPCAADVNGDDVVNVQDLLDLLAAWGPCS